MSSSCLCPVCGGTSTHLQLTEIIDATVSAVFPRILVGRPCPRANGGQFVPIVDPDETAEMQAVEV